MVYLSGPAIAILCLRTRMAINFQMRRGQLGPLIQRDGMFYAALEAVERRTGQTFTAEQIAAATAGHPRRRIDLPTEEAA
jgi:hypothetical protein